MADTPNVKTEILGQQSHSSRILQAPGNFVGQVYDSAADAFDDAYQRLDEASGGKVKTIIDKATDILGNLREKLGGAFESANYNADLQGVYARREQIVSAFAAGFHAHAIDPATMKEMQILEKTGALGNGDSSARISAGILPLVLENPTAYGLNPNGQSTINNDKTQLTVTNFLKK